MDTKTAPTVVGPHEGLLDWLAGHRIEYVLREHVLAFTARETARAEGVDPRSFAKVVGVTTEDDREALLVVEAPDHVSLAKARRLLGSDHVRLMTEPELARLAPDCELGALPAVGELFGLRTYADYALRDAPEISFTAGSHSFDVRVDRREWQRAAGVVYADLVEADERLPAWARS